MMNPDRLRELADDLERYQQITDDDERASWERAIAVELADDIRGPLEGWVWVRERDFDDLQRMEVWGRVLRFMIAPLAVGVALGLLLWRTLDLLPEWAALAVIAGLSLAGIVWTIRQVRWAERMKREIAADLERLGKLTRKAEDA